MGRRRAGRRDAPGPAAPASRAADHPAESCWWPRRRRPAGLGLVVRVVLTPQQAGWAAVAAVPPCRRPGLADEMPCCTTLGQQAGRRSPAPTWPTSSATSRSPCSAACSPTSCPTTRGCELATCYSAEATSSSRSAATGSTRSAWTDRVALVVGDVVGRGVHAAGPWAAAQRDPRARPRRRRSRCAARTPRPLRRRRRPARTWRRWSTPSSTSRRTLRYACAGHPPPVLVDATGPTSCGTDGRHRSAPLWSAGPRSEAATILAPGSRLVLYTDGLVERRDRRWTRASSAGRAPRVARRAAARDARRRADRERPGHRAHGGRRLRPHGGLPARSLAAAGPARPQRYVGHHTDGALACRPGDSARLGCRAGSWP